MVKNNKTTISVVIPTYNSWLTLKDCIFSIQKQTLKPYEIIVIDNNSSDGTTDKAKKKFPNVNLITLDKNTGVTGGRNEGIRKAAFSSDYLFFFDHDMVADKNMLKELIKVAEMDPNIGIITPKIYYWGKKKRIWSAGTGINLWTGRIIFRGGEDRGQYDTAEEVQVAPAAILVKKSLIKKVKSFDDNYFACYEDTDFCFRAREKGFKTFYAPRAIAYHILSWDPKDDADRVLSRAYWIGRNRVLFMKDFGNNFYVFLFFLPLFLAYYLKLAISRRRFIDWLAFIKGTLEGLTISIFSRKIIFSGERPSLSDIEGLHLAKYKFASPFCKGKNVLEVGCGSGYGSKYLADNGVKKIMAVDIDPSAVSFARKNLFHPNIEFEEGDAESMKVKNKYDVILSFEVIEHLNNSIKLLELASRSMKKDGIFVLSTPNKKYSILNTGEPSNPYHVYEYYPQELKKILLKYFKSVQLYGVILNNKETAKREKMMQNSWRWRLVNYLVNKRGVRRFMNYLPQYPKRLISGEFQLSFKTEDFRIVKDKAEVASDFVAVCKLL